MTLYEYMNALEENYELDADVFYDGIIIKMLRAQLLDYRKHWQGDIHDTVVHCIDIYGPKRLYKKIEAMGLVQDRDFNIPSGYIKQNSVNIKTQ